MMYDQELKSHDQTWINRVVADIMVGNSHILTKLWVYLSDALSKASHLTEMFPNARSNMLH